MVTFSRVSDVASILASVAVVVCRSIHRKVLQCEETCTKFLADNEDGPWRHVVENLDSLEIGQCDVFNPGHIASSKIEYGTNGHRVAHARHRDGCNVLFLDWHSERMGFTLIELLVVIGIIAILLSILVPSLNSVKRKARLILCMANTKEIGRIVQVYRVDNDDLVPPVANRDAADGAYTGEPAGYAYLSIALRDYNELRGLDEEYVTQSYGPIVGASKYQYFCDNLLPKFYSCPFVRNKKVAPPVQVEDVVIDGSAVKAFKIVGRGGSYATWRWGAYRNGNIRSNVGINYNYGTPKWGAVPWVKTAKVGCDYYTAQRNQTKWDSSEYREFGIGAPFDMSILYCEQGENNNWAGRSGPDWGIFNPGSHARGKVGGTTVLMCDGHTEWVEGLRVGWP